jgi:IS4 transposase
LQHKKLRKVVIKREDKETDLVLITNNFELAATEIGDLYKKRWAIELYFKWIKQKLKIKKFIGRSENAIKIQIYTALIAYLLIAIFRDKAKLKVKPMKLIFDLIKSYLMLSPHYIIGYCSKPTERTMFYEEKNLPLFNFGQ